MKIRRILAMIIALCFASCACAGAEGLGGLIQQIFGGSDEQTEQTEAPEAAEGETLPDEEWAEDEAEVGEDGYVFDEPEDDIVVEELIPVEDYAITEGLDERWLNILLLGTDARGTNRYSRTDSMIVLSVNAETGEAKLSSIMRDIWVSLPGHGGAKLNAACVYGGPAMTMRTINEYFHLNIQYYALVNMRCLVDIVDALGGIRLEVTPAERRAVNRLISSDAQSGDGNRAFATAYLTESGPDVLLTGKQALAYSRIRKSDSDYARTERQRKVLVTIAKQLQEQGMLMLTTMIPGLLQYVETNLTFDQVMTLAATGMGLDMGKITQFRVPADGTYEAGMFGTTWCIKPDFEENARQLHAFIYGE